jgi:putative cardiolipin synthase
MIASLKSLRCVTAVRGRKAGGKYPVYRFGAGRPRSETSTMRLAGNIITGLVNHGMLMRRIIEIGFPLVASVLLAACATVPLDHPKQASAAITATEGTKLARFSTEWRDGNQDRNGFYPLNLGLDAFGARLSLADRAEVSIDAQYFLMKPDAAGLVFADRLLDAAERGVRVRLLLDDVFTTVEDGALALLDAHPKIEVRIFNPVARQGVYAFNYVGNFELANRRMHNKSFTVDNQVSIVGGRNIAVEYFQLETTGEFIDFDMLTVGPIVREVSRSFDDYWNDVLAVPLDALHDAPDRDKITEWGDRIMRGMAEAGNSVYAAAVNTELMQQFDAGEVQPFLANARIIVDRPDKLREEISEEHKIVAREIGVELSGARSEIIIWTPYFIPRQRGIELLRELTARGVRVVLVTNSLATNNHTAVHSAYSRYRKDVLQAGVELWEARADAARITAEDGSTELERLTLHTKGILIDREKVFVGSLNLDPRSIDINTEMGLLIESEKMGRQLSESSLARIENIAYRLQLDDDGDIAWHANIDGRQVVETSEPQASWWRRFSAWVQKIAPEDQL